MKELLRTNNVVTISFVTSLMKDAGIACFVADENMSVLDGSIGILPRRMMVADRDLFLARATMSDNGVAVSE